MRRQWLFALIPLLSVACSSDPGVRVVTDQADTTHSSTTVPPPDSGAHAPTSDGSDPALGDGVGDELFPALGNPGIDVEHYDLHLAYDPATGQLDGVVGIDLRLTDDRREITLDSVGPDIVGVAVDGADSEFAVEPEELRIDLPDDAATGDSLHVDVEYSVQPEPIESPGGITSGWFRTEGGSYVLNEPDGARTWLPCNDHPSDKATYHFALTVPTGLAAVANGALVGHTTDASGEHWSWEETAPMATYLLQVLTGNYEIVTDVGPHDLPLLSVVLASDRTAMQPYLDTIGEQVAFFEEWFGPYPLDRYGIAMTDSSPGLAMEEQERSLFSRTDFLSGMLGRDEQFLLAHELAHQWFGDAVTPARWRDIWLNESFATYAEWMWLEHVGITTVDLEATQALQMRADRSAADPTAAELFDYNSYDGGAVVLHALRAEVGDAVFFDILRTWVEQYTDQSVTTDEFVECAEAVSGRSLTDFFAAWLYADRVPAAFPA